MAKFRIGQRVLLLFIGVSLIPLLIAIIFLVRFGQNKLESDAVSQQLLVAQKSAGEVDNFLGSKVNVLIFQSQTSSIRKFQANEAALNLATAIKQDRDMEKITLVDKSGKEFVSVDRNGVLPEHSDLSTNDAFKASTFLAGKEYIGPVTYDKDGKPRVVIAVPLIRFTEQQDLSHLSTADFGQYRTADDIQGVLIANYDLDNLWQSVLSTQIGHGGYAYLVDDKGNLIAHPDSKFMATHQNIANVHQVKHALSNEHDMHEAPSETGVPVISNFAPVSRTNWSVIVEEPTASIFAATNTFTRYAVFAFIVIASAVIGLSLLFRRQLLNPIRNLSAGAHKIGAGDFNYMIPVTSQDELGDLASTFNSMGHNLSELVHDLQAKNLTLAAQEGKLSSIIQSVSDGVVALDTAGMIVNINPPAAKLLNKTEKKLIGQSFNKLFSFTRDNEPFELNFSKPGMFLYHDLILAADDKHSYVDLSMAVVEPSNSSLSAIITLHDLTPSRELEMMKLDFVTIAAHELRTPLTVVRGYLNLINSDAINQLSVLNIENLQHAVIGAEQLSNIINNLLNVSRIERGAFHIVPTKTNIVELIKQVILQQQVTARLKDQKLVYVGSDEPVYIYGDVSTISEVINNLVSNALKYTQANGHVNVKIVHDKEHVRLEVHDNGPGIPEAAQDHLFTKFYRVEHTLTSGNRGTGLGLFIARTIIEAHGGKIGVVSHVHKGSIFYFTLPLYSEKLAQSNNSGKELVGSHGWITKRSHR